MSIDIINYAVSWQKLRVSTLPQNNPYGGMTTPDGANDAMARMMNYIHDTDQTYLRSNKVSVPQYVQNELNRMGLHLDQEYAARVYRVYRYLTATVNGLQGSVKSTGHIESIRNLARRLGELVDLHRCQQVADTWNWDVVRYDLETLWRQERYWFMAIDADMKERVEDKGKSAQNMLDFIGIMREVNSLGTAN